jgi:deferrochelatase/peroxidase EfeB
VLLGYENAYGVFPLSPTVPDDAWSSQHLAKTPPDPNLTPARDLGRNGSYVVFRQLHQDVHAFWKYVDEHARRELQARSVPPQNADEQREQEEKVGQARKFLAAKMVGRWPNGAPLARYPDHEPSAAEVKKLEDEEKLNAFFYSDTLDHRGDDLSGDRCPIGSHIRRTNPRDGMHPDTVESLKVADRHRLLRRGRAYGEPLSSSFDPHDILQSGGGGRRGLHFICFNTDIGRQFEFVQSTWANSAKFDGLNQDRDAIIAPATVQGPKEQTSNFTMQGLPARQRCQVLPRFVTMIGGAYLFMPGLKAMRFLALDPRGSQNDPAGNRSSRD